MSSATGTRTDLAQTMVNDLRRQFPGTLIWWGKATRAWWATTPDHNGVVRLVEAPGLPELATTLGMVAARQRLMTTR
ncbi:hypothetical protein ACFQ07_28405, partial [Actinomadura adrarensis]